MRRMKDAIGGRKGCMAESLDGAFVTQKVRSSS